jgi:hypothetical protein
MPASIKFSFVDLDQAKAGHDRVMCHEWKNQGRVVTSDEIQRSRCWTQSLATAPTRVTDGATTVSFRTALGAIPFLVLVLPSLAGPCSSEVALVQSQLDAKTQAIIDTARFAQEARRALGLPPLKESSSASNGRRHADASWLAEAIAAMAQARDADRTGDVLLCEQALAAARRAIGK